ncbi:hypothetical protein Taro_029465, partial [Colocasia esculenta]|nr:hypothetical protein [Colocasia esculenta]
MKNKKSSVARNPSIMQRLSYHAHKSLTKDFWTKYP